MLFIAKVHEKKMPAAAIGVVLAVSALPLVLIALGVQFSTDPNSPISNYLHTLAEWSGVCVAIMTVFLAFLHYYEKGESTTPIIGLAWLCAGLMDIFHTLGADGLISAAAGVTAFTECTWVISRSANALILIAGATLFLVSGRTLSADSRKRGMSFILILSALIGLLALASIYACATRDALPNALRPLWFATRAWDLVPLCLYVFAGAFVFPMFYKWHPSVFTHALLYSMIPHAASQLHMALGSAVVFDSHYHAAHFLKIIAYAVPLVGLMMDYRLTHAQSMQAEEERAGEHLVRQQAEEALTRDRSVLKILMDQTADMVSIKDASLHFTRVNRTQCEWMGLARPLDAAGKSDEEFFDAAFAASSRKQDKQVLESGSPIQNISMEVARDGKTVGVTASKFPLKNNDGQTVGIVTITRRR